MRLLNAKDQIIFCGPDDDLISSDRTALTEYKDTELRDYMHSHRHANLPSVAIAD